MNINLLTLHCTERTFLPKIEGFQSAVHKLGDFSKILEVKMLSMRLRSRKKSEKCPKLFEDKIICDCFL